MANCGKCNRKIEGKRSEHICDMAKLEDGRLVHMDRLRDEKSDLRKQVEAGAVKVEYQIRRNQPLRRVSEKLGLAREG